ncbi:hypothetical protein CI109_104224 [Kwoniella shandongensis]|uniref:HECT-type E3 ubiquitin transferase n=1 Tax=Kwoniella shandongensis TaxID=1734106 RepID=A0A5M6C263_9TREE|nr:uncharacterized protein CI109_002868 [Kwoniella shandongensis]KAA5528710.1 hypothetical protein CI109_002868 [Kwoniella shandongensis]
MKVKKSAKKQSPPSRDVAALVERILAASDQELVNVLQPFQSWKYARGDLHAWIPVLDRFDSFLEDTIKSYDLTKLQINDFTPKTKELLLEVLRVQRLLLENCTNRKLFASYDRLADLLLTNDLDVLYAAIFVLLRPAQTYAVQTPLEPPQRHAILHRLLTLSRGWEKLINAGYDLASLASADEFTLPDTLSSIQAQFYPTSQSSKLVEHTSPAKPATSHLETPTRPRHALQTHQSSSSTPLSKYKPGSASQAGPAVIDLSAIATSSSFNYTDQLAILAEENHMSLEDQYLALNKLRLVILMKDKRSRRQMLAIRLLALATYVQISSEDASQSGLFLYEPELVSQLADVLRAASDVGEEVALTSLLALDACAHHRAKTGEVMTAVCANVNHGIIISFFRNMVDQLVRGSDISPDLVDASMSFIAFISSSSVHNNMLMGAGILRLLLNMLGTVGQYRDSYVPRATGLIDSIIFSNPQALSNFSAIDGVNTLVQRVRIEIDTRLESTLEPASEIMLEVAYANNPLRSIIRSLQRLMQASGGTEGLRNLVDSDLPKSLKRIFGDSAKFGPRVYALAINTMATFVHNEPTSLAILQEMQLPQTLYAQLEQGVPPSYEVISTVSNAIGAMCLNQSGLDHTLAHPGVITNLVNTVILSSHESVFNERDNGRHLGSSLDELARHHPALRPIILQSCLNLLKQATDAGAAFQPDETQRRDYSLEEMSQTQSSQADEVRPLQSPPSNPCLSTFSRVFKVLSGLLRSPGISKDFIKEGGLDLLLGVADLPCLPIRFGGTDAASSLAHLLKHIGEHSHVELIDAIVASIQDAMSRSSGLWKESDVSSKWLAMHAGNADPEIREQFNSLRSLAVRLTFLSEALFALSFSHARIGTSIIKALGVTNGSTFIEDLGRVHRVCFRHHALLRISKPPPSDAAAGLMENEEIAPAPTPNTSDDPSKESGAKYLATRLHASLAKFFRSIIKLLFVRRNPEPAHKEQARALADCIAVIIIGHLEETPDVDSSVSIDTVALGVVTMLLFDVRGTEGHLNTTLFLSFERKGGFDYFIATSRRIVSAMEATAAIDVNSRNQLQTDAYVEATAGLKIVLLLLVAFVSPKSLLENPETHALEQRQPGRRDPNFVPTNLFVNLRSAVFPLVHQIWEADWLLHCPIPILKLTVRCFSILMEGKHETPPEAEPAASVGAPIVAHPPRPAPITADPARVNQLVDMGFPRGAAERALLRARNNIATATELILSMPHVFQDDPPVNNQPAPEVTPVEPIPEVTAESAPEPAPEPTNMDVDPDSVSSATPESAAIARTELTRLRVEYRPSMYTRGLTLLDQAEDLVFDLVACFPSGEEGVTYLMRQLLEVSLAYDASREGSISARLRLLSVFLKSGEGIILNEAMISEAVEVLSSLPIENEPRPRWLPALFLFAESVFVSADAVTKVKIGDGPELAVIVDAPALAPVHARLSALCTKLVAAADVTRDELIAGLRLLVFLSRQSEAVLNDNDKAINALKPFKKPSDKLSGCHPLLVMIVRHAFEDPATVTEVIRSEIKQWLTPARNKVADINHFVKQLRPAALRQPACFVRAVEMECALNDPKPPQSVYHIRGREESKESPSVVPSSDPFQESADTYQSHPVVDHLLLELGEAVHRCLETSGEPSEPTLSTPDDVAHALTYTGLTMSLLTELLGSYNSAKKAFVASLRNGGLGAISKSKSGISALINELICCVVLQPDITPESERSPISARRIAVSSWASSMIVALCSDVSTSNGQKDHVEDMISIRKTILEAVVKTLRETATVTDLNIRYGRLWALGELISRLLMARSNVVSRQPNESGLQMAKTMLEKNFVGLITTALGEVDLNYPDIRNVLVTLLKALEHLSKLSVKWGKANKEQQGDSKNPLPTNDDDDESSSSHSGSDSDVEMIEEDQSAPDLYRNSALGMIGGELGDDEDDDDGDEDDENDDMDMGDDLTDGDDGTDMQTSDDESMGTDMEHDDWTDELAEGEEDTDGDEDMDQEVILGSGDDEEAEIWEDVPDDHESLTTDDQDDDEGDDDIHAEGFFGDDGELDDMEMEDEEEFDQIEMLESFPSATQSSAFRQSPQLAGPWGWNQSSGGAAQSFGDRRHRSLLSDQDAAVSLFGAPQTLPASNIAQHPLITDPMSQSAPMRGLPRSLGGGNYNDLLLAIEQMGGSEAVQMLENVIASRQLAGSDAIRIDFAQDQSGTIGLSVGGRTFALNNPAQRQSSTATNVVSAYVPLATLNRWQEEMMLCSAAKPESVSRLVVHIINRLMPEARRRAEEEEARLKQAEVDAAKAEAVEKNKTLESATSVALPGSRQSSPSPEDDEDEDIAMNDSDSESGGSEENADSTDNGADGGTLARTIITIHGQEVDITDTGIDLEFLQALPDDMRADVVEQYMGEQNRQRRPAATNVPEASEQINAEFLDALPPDIRAEVIMQEAMQNARRIFRPTPGIQLPSGRSAAGQGGTAGFLANLTDELRDVMLLGQPENPLNIIPTRNPLGGPSVAVAAESSTAPKKPHREAIQLLDKPGIASLVRLLFFPQTLKKGYLFKVMVNLCENSNTRTDLLNLLLSVVQDGSGDLPAVDRSFQQMSLRGVSTPKATPKGKAVDSPAAAVVPSGLFSHLQTEHVPTFIAQRCFEALVYIVNANSNAVSYFLTEHEQPVGLRKHTSKKGKGKDKLLPQTKFPIVVLLGLLDRPLLAKTPGMMETVTALLATITRPLIEYKNQSAAAPAASHENVETATSTAREQAPTESAELAAVSEAPPSDSPKTPTKSTPIIPPAVLRLIVNCLTSGECTRSTFSQTLVVMQNLACLPDAKEVILQELRARCRELGVMVQEQLDELATTLEGSSADVGPLTLAKFSHPTSSQAQLLRLLKTIDYLHLNKVDSDAPVDDMTEEERAVSQVFESFDFEDLWTHLGRCLSLVEAREGSDQTAMVLLPLVEALMVISKYRSRTQREARSPSLSASGVDSSDLFVSFTTTHRKVLNTIVRNNPSLLSGSFSLLIRNPRVLEFDNKRNWFFQKLKRKRDDSMPPSVLHLNIRRQYVFEDSFRALQRRTGDEIKYGKLSVKFHHEDGVDAGGVTREWYSVLAQQIFDPNFALFEPCAADQQTYQPNKASSVNGDHLSYFKFVGRVIGKAVYDGRLLDAYFNRAFYKQILGRTVDMRDLESIDPEYHKSLQWMLDNDITGVIDQEFTTEDDQFGEKKIVELKEGGAQIPVTEENKEEYVRLVVSYRLDNSIKDQIKAFLDGFYEIIPREIIQIFEPDQLELLISGITTVDVDELKNATQMSGWKPTDPEISWFWRALRSFSQEERSRFLMFVTSSSRVPLGGFTQLQGSSGIQPFQIQKLYAKEGSLPQASTCFNLLLLPPYATYEQLRERLQFAITETGGFGKA